MQRSKGLMTLGLAARAGKVSSGEMMVEKAIRGGKAYLLLIAEDASEATKKRFTDHASYYQVPYLFVSDRETLGRAIGKDYRATVVVGDEKLAALIKEQLEAEKA